MAYNIAPLCSYNGYHRVLDVYGGLSSTDKRVWTYPNNGANEELFWFEKVGTDLYVISFANNSSYVLDMDASGNVVAKTRSGGTSQQWYVTKDTTYNSAETRYKGYNWSWAISNTSHTSAYGQRTLDGGASFNIHSGLDTAAPNGTSVYLPAAATYALAGYDTTYSCGYYLVIQANTYVYGSSTIKL